MGKKVIVIHPGSRFLRIGRASDAYPIITPHCIARRIRASPPSAVITNGSVIVDAGSGAAAESQGDGVASTATEVEAAEADQDKDEAMDVDEDDDEDSPHSPVPDVRRVALNDFCSVYSGSLVSLIVTPTTLLLHTLFRW